MKPSKTLDNLWKGCHHWKEVFSGHQDLLQLIALMEKQYRCVKPASM